MALSSLLLPLLWVAVELNRSSWNTGQWVERQQPVQFSHKHHVGDDGIDCRYCHTSVETSASAGMPSTSTCMSCHKQIWADSPYLETGAREFPHRQADRVGTRTRSSRLRLLQSQHSREKRRRLFDVSRPRRRHADRLPGSDRCRWSGVWSVIASRKDLCVRLTEIFNMEWRKENKTQEELTKGFDLKTEYKIQGRASSGKLFHLPPVDRNER